MKLSPSPNKSKSKKLLEILVRTAGAWKNDDWQETEKKRRKIELQATKEKKTF